MSVNDMIKKSVLNSFSQYNVPKMALALLVALLVLWLTHSAHYRFRNLTLLLVSILVQIPRC